MELTNKIKQKLDAFAKRMESYDFKVKFKIVDEKQTMIVIGDDSGRSNIAMRFCELNNSFSFYLDNKIFDENGFRLYYRVYAKGD